MGTQLNNLLLSYKGILWNTQQSVLFFSLFLPLFPHPILLSLLCGGGVVLLCSPDSLCITQAPAPDRPLGVSRGWHSRRWPETSQAAPPLILCPPLTLQVLAQVPFSTPPGPFTCPVGAGVVLKGSRFPGGP